MKLNNKGQVPYFLIGALVFGIMFGGLGFSKLSKLNPFKAKAGIVQKDEGRSSEYFKDRIKGLEYRSETSHKSQNTDNAANSGTIGSTVGNFIDSSIQLIVFVIIGGVLLLLFTGINIFKYIKRAGTIAKDAAVEANKYRKALKQTVKAIDVASPKMNGEDKVLKEQLSRKQDEDTEVIIRRMKNE